LIERMSLFTTKHKGFSLTTLQLFFRKLSIYFIGNVASVCSRHTLLGRILGQRSIFDQTLIPSEAVAFVATRYSGNRNWDPGISPLWTQIERIFLNACTLTTSGREFNLHAISLSLFLSLFSNVRIVCSARTSDALFRLRDVRISDICDAPPTRWLSERTRQPTAELLLRERRPACTEIRRCRCARAHY